MENDELQSNELEVWDNLLDELLVLNYNQNEEITAVEQKIYEALRHQPSHIIGLITLMYAQIMLGNRSKANALALKIWDIGGSLDPFYEFVFVENLLSLGLLDMASVLLKPRFENLRESIDMFYPAMVKFAVMTGNISLLNRIAEYPDIPVSDDDLFALADVYTESQAVEIFKNIQKIILENCAEYLCSYEYALYHDRGFPELEIILYVNSDPSFCAHLQASVDAKITAFWRSMGQERLNNFSITVTNIKDHIAWDAE